jgi:hypothetical protein
MAVLDDLAKSFNNEVGNQMKLLLEMKHIYQKVTLDVAKLLADYNIKSDEDRKYFNAYVDEYGLSPSLDQSSIVERNSTYTPTPVLLLRNVKLFCTVCGARETYAPIWFKDITNEIRITRHSQSTICLSHS